MDATYTACPERLIPLPEVMRRTSKGKSSIYAAIRTKPPTFPLPVKVGISTRWLESEIDDYIRKRVVERDAKGAA